MDGDDELAAIRAKRMAEMRGTGGGAAAGAAGLPAGLAPSSGPSGGGKDDADKLAGSYFDCETGKGEAVEDLLIRMAQSGQLRGKITRRPVADSDDDEDLLAGL
ncbi:hypothetical protein BCR33DRAFT_711708 [Rhizoclosmatium globosum]|uniref:Uncharacterized protein n=1 Tax=Rhizoclosmatium globosum TaxID=329046 RepID=A0A1Y2CZC6_9FUNG|nr:hypothetical protein BCR33DRAFT_711708 [Rhizoclosmatium globosum]|eukprot:ORY52383.1 hypothetical protein BCR33DRAFT_711708 [Rhizoclosmatium globosum]